MIGGHALATAVQLAGIGDALYFAHGFSTAARLIESDVGLKRGLRIVKFAFLNRACELACTPVHIRPVETSNGIDYAWYTYRPEAGNQEGQSCALVWLGYEREMTEDQARSKAMGY